jgi:glucose/arabinose dehydrogenase
MLERTMKRLLVVALLVASGCGGGAPVAARTPGPTLGPTSASARPGSSPTATEGVPKLSSLRLRLQEIARLDSPIAMAIRQGDDNLYIAEKSGKVVGLRPGRAAPFDVLDLSNEVSNGGEQGLLGLAFDPVGSYLYVDYTDVGGDTRVVEFRMKGDLADMRTRRQLLFVDQPFSNHNGGNVVFGPDGYLYVGLGDGGSGGDPRGYGQSLDTFLGKILRIDPRPSGGKPHGIPPDNPFVGRAGARPEIWAYGLRNPWRFEFDRQTGDLWIADVGQSSWEEIDFQPAGSKGGQNYGWNRMEGSHPYQGTAPANAVPPVYEYSHDEGGCSITGGYVYRGSDLPGLVGAYLFSDFCAGEVMALRLKAGKVVDHASLGLKLTVPSSFGEDQDGELYLLSLQGPVYRIVAGG